MGTKTKASFLLSVVAASVVGLVAALFSWAQLVTTSDTRIFKADDDNRTRMIARACEPRGKLWRQPDTGDYACVFTNPNGDSLVQSLPNAPYLDAVEDAGHTLVARK